MKRIIRILLGLLLLLAAVLAIRWGWGQYAIRPLRGKLTASLPPQEAAFGAFTLRFDGKQVTIVPANRPDFALWQSLPGRAFVLAARGQADVQEARGMFRISDRLVARCTAQSLTGLEAAGESVRLTGELACDGENVAYTLIFTALDDRQVAFDLRLADPSFNRLFLTYASDRDEHFWGFGEQFTYLDLKGRRVPIWVSEQGVGRGEQPITLGADLTNNGAGGKWYTTYAPMPHYLTSRLRSLFLETSAYSLFDLRADDFVQVQVWDASLQGRVFYGDSPLELLEIYTAWAGRMPPLPDWLLRGVVVGMQGGTQRVREVYAQLKARDVPVSAFWLQDWVGQRTTSFGKQLWWNWELDEDHYPGWDALQADLEADGVRLMVYVSPFLADVSEKPNARRNLFAEARDLGYLVQDASGAPYMLQNTSFSAALVDLSNPQAYAWYKDVLREQLGRAHAAGWMADFGEALPWDAAVSGDLPAPLLHNRYPELWAQLNRELVDENGQEQVFFMRSAYSRSPAYATLFWAGDQLVSWDANDGMQSALTGLLSGGLSGMTLNHADVGGYTTITNPIATYHRDEELLLRWMEWSAFSPLFRTHEGNQPENNVQFYSNERTLNAFARSAKIYAALADYRRALMQQAAEHGWPLMRPLFLHYPDDPQTWGLTSEYLFGPDLLIAPVFEPGAQSVRVYLPAGEWVHLWSGQTYTGGQTVEVPAPIGQPGVFYRQGAAVGERLRADLQAAGLLDALP